MVVNSKAYTLNRLISEVREVSRTDAKSVGALFESLSPRKGKQSAKVAKMDEFLDYQLDAVVKESSLGATPRQRLLNALKFRKKYGFNKAV